MAELDGTGGGAVGKIWRKHGGGYYALIAVGTFVYLEIQSFVDSFMTSEGVGGFVKSELMEAVLTFGIETVVNSFMAGIWLFMWISWMGLSTTLMWAGGGYVAWTILLAVLLARREKEYRRELGL